MSITKIPTKVQLQVWLKAGGRCQYQGCNIPLWKDTLTLAKMNRAYLAHIVSDSPDGPRGDPILSYQLKKEPTNLMLLCDTHHRLVDIEQPTQHPPERLREYKRLHEERIERLTALQSNLRTEILLFGTRIGERQGMVNFDDACEAVLPERYPADEKGIRIDLVDVNINEQDPLFWNLVTTHIDRELGRFLGDSKGPSGMPLNHLSIFALAPIPVLIYLGKKLGDIRSADVYQRHRQPAGWKWQNLQEQSFEYTVEYPNQEITMAKKRVVVNLSLSGPIHNADIEQYLGEKFPIITISIAEPRKDFLKSKEQLELFCNIWYHVISRILGLYGFDCEIHLFAAIPNSIAVEIGRSLLKIDPTMIVYERYNGNFQRTIAV